MRLTAIKKLCIFLILLFSVNISFSQISFQINGELIDSSSNMPLQYASVMLVNHNDVIIAGTITKDNGKFNFSIKNESENIFLLVKNIGYLDKKIDLTFNVEQARIDLGKIYISRDEIQLKGIVFDGTQNYIEKQIDRKVFNISTNKLANARTILDLLRSLPGVIVDEDGIVRYKGAEANIYVDDLQLKYMYSNIEMIPVEKVDKIELIDVAMRTGGDGRGGIINIKLKSTDPNGFSGMASVNIGTIKFQKLGFSKAFLNINYKYNKLTFFLNSSFDYNLRYSSIERERNINIPEFQSIQNENYYEFSKRLGSYNYLGMIYNPSPNTKVRLSGHFLYSPLKMQYTNSFIEHNKVNQEILNKYDENGNSTNDQLNTGATLSYWHKFDTLDTYIRAFGNFTMYNTFSNRISSYKYNIIDLQNNIDSVYSYRNENKFHSKSLYFNVFYNHSVTEKLRWNLAYDLSIKLKDTSANNHYIFDKLYLPQSQYANNFLHSHDLSFRIGGEFKKWTIDAGINVVGEFNNGSFLRYNLQNEDTIIPLNKYYIKALPSLTVAFSITNTSDVKLTLSKTVDMPYFRQLSDYVDKTNLYNWISGNSKLKPVDFYSIYLGYVYNREKLNVSIDCFFNYTNNEVANIPIPTTSLIFLTKPVNASQQTNLGIDFSIWYMPIKKLNMSLSSSIFHTYYNSKSLKEIAILYDLPIDSYVNRQFGYYIKFSVDYSIKILYATFYINYFGKELTFDGYEKGYINSSFSIGAKFFKNKLRIVLGMSNIFDDFLKHGSYSNQFGIRTDTQRKGSNYERNYYISIQYNFRYGDRGTKDLR
jgi:hypothetical protein